MRKKSRVTFLTHKKVAGVTSGDFEGPLGPTNHRSSHTAFNPTLLRVSITTKRSCQS